MIQTRSHVQKVFPEAGVQDVVKEITDVSQRPTAVILV